MTVAQTVTQTSIISLPSAAAVSTLAVLHITLLPAYVLAFLGANIIMSLIAKSYDSTVKQFSLQNIHAADMSKTLTITLVMGFLYLLPYVFSPLILAQFSFLGTFLALHYYIPHIIVGSLVLIDAIMRSQAIQSASNSLKPEKRMVSEFEAKQKKFEEQRKEFEKKREEFEKELAKTRELLDKQQIERAQQAANDKQRVNERPVLIGEARAELEQEIIKLTEQITLHEQNYKTATSALEETQNALEGLGKEKAESDTKLKLAQQTVDEQKAEIDGLKDKRESLQRTTSELNQKIADKQKTIDGQDTQIVALKGKSPQQRRQIQQAEAQLIKLTNEKTKLEQRLAESQSKLDEKTGEIKAKEDALREADTALDVASRENDAMAATLSTTQNELEEYHGQLEALSKEKQENEKNLLSAQQQIRQKEEELVSVKDSVESLKKANFDATTRITTLEQQLTDATSAATKSQEETKSLQRELQEIKAALETSNTYGKEQRDEVDRLTQMENQLTQKVFTLQGRDSTLQQHIEGLQAQIADYNNTIEQQNERIGAYKNHSPVRKKELKELAVARTKVETLKNQLEEAQQQASETRDELETKITELDANSAALKQKNQEIDEIGAKNLLLENQITEISSKLQAAESSTMVSKQCIHDLEDQIANMRPYQTQYEELIQKFDKQTQEALIAQEREQELTSQIVALTQHSNGVEEKAKAALVESEEKLTQLHVDVDTAQALVQQLTKELEEKTQAVANEEGKNTKLEATIAMLKKDFDTQQETNTMQLKALESQYLEANDSLRKKEESLTSAESHIEILKGKLSDLEGQVSDAANVKEQLTLKLEEQALTSVALQETKNALKESEERLTQLQTAVDTAQALVQQHTKELEEKTQAVAYQREQNTKLEAAIAMLKKDFDTQQKTNTMQLDALESQYLAANDSLREKEENLTAAENHIETLKGKLSDLEAEKRELLERGDQHKQAQKASEAELAQLHDDLTSVQRELLELGDQHGLAQKEKDAEIQKAQQNTQTLAKRLIKSLQEVLKYPGHQNAEKLDTFYELLQTLKQTFEKKKLNKYFGNAVQDMIISLEGQDIRVLQTYNEESIADCMKIVDFFSRSGAVNEVTVEELDACVDRINEVFKDMESGTDEHENYKNFITKLLELKQQYDDEERSSVAASDELDNESEYSDVPSLDDLDSVYGVFSESPQKQEEENGTASLTAESLQMLMFQEAQKEQEAQKAKAQNTAAALSKVGVLGTNDPQTSSNEASPFVNRRRGPGKGFDLTS